MSSLLTICRQARVAELGFNELSGFAHLPELVGTSLFSKCVRKESGCGWAARGRWTALLPWCFLIPLSLTDPALPFPDSPTPLLFFSFFLVHKLPCFSHPLMISWSCLRKQEYFSSLPQTPPLCSSRASEEFFPKVFFSHPPLSIFP